MMNFGFAETSIKRTDYDDNNYITFRIRVYRHCI